MSLADTSSKACKVLVVHGSPRANGNTDLLAGLLLREMESLGPVEQRHVWAARLAARPCLACGGCDKTGQCVLRDDMRGVYDSVLWADRMVVAVPVFFASVTAQLKAVIDRFQCAWVAKYRLGRPWIEPSAGRQAWLVSAGGMNIQRHLRQTKDVVRSWLTVINYTLAGDSSFLGVDARGEVLDADGLADQMRGAALALYGDPAARAAEEPDR